jgi:DNA-directed RNA polymerase alpha subunit
MEMPQMNLVERLRTPDAMAMRQAADEIEALHAMLMEPDWNAAQQAIARWRKARGVGARPEPEITAPLDEAFLDQRINDRALGRGLFGPGYGVRASNILNVRTIRDLVRMEEFELRREPNVGQRTINIIKAVLAQHGLHLGMNV